MMGVFCAQTTVTPLLLLLVGFITHIPMAMSNPVPLRSDIISGQDFLSLFMAESPPQDPYGSSTENSYSSPEAAIPDDEPVAAGDITTSAYDDDDEGDIGNEIISSDPSEESPPLTTTLVTGQQPTATTNQTPSAAGGDRSARTLSSSSIASNKRVIVRKLVQRNGRTRIATTTTANPPKRTVTSSTLAVGGQPSASSSSGDTNYLEDSEKMPLNSHRSELFIDEADSKDLLNSESMNVPRIAQLLPVAGSSAVLLQPSSLVKTSSSSSSSQLDANGATDNGNLKRNSPFTLQRRPPSVAAIPSLSSSGSNSSSSSARAATTDDDYDQEANASNNDQLVQERRMSTSRSRSKQPTDAVDVPAAAPPAETPPSSPSYQTVVYGGQPHQQQHRQPPQPASPIRLPVPRSISYGSLTQKVDPVAGNKINWNFPTIRRLQNETSVHKGAAAASSPPYQAKVYSEPAKVYSEPAKVYSEPAKVYSEPAKVYSEPAKFYSEPAKVYSEPARNYGVPPTPFPITPSTTPNAGLPAYQPNRKVLFNLDKLPYDLLNAPNRNLNLQPKESSVAAKEKSNVEEIFLDSTKKGETNEQSSNVPQSVGEDDREGEGPALEVRNQTQKGDNPNKTGYVVEGRHYRKYRVEEKTPDGFIVGEYGVVTHNDGHLRGVRYTADSNINPRLIYDALLKFLSL